MHMSTSRAVIGFTCGVALLVAGGCSQGQVDVPGNPAAPASTQASPASAIEPGTITFDGLTEHLAAVSTYSERGFTLQASGGSWQAVTSYGTPPPFIAFTVGGGSTVTGELQVTGGGQTFSFESVDLYASTTPIPYVITGSRNGATVFTIDDRLPNTFGNFRQVRAGDPSAVIDTLTIRLINAAAPCCTNPMGLDNIVLK
jgi:hypothetical protein